MTPALTYFYAAPAVAMVAFVALVFAARNHASPYIVFGNSAAIAITSMLESSAASGFKFTQKAAATFNATGLKIVDGNSGDIPAITNTMPVDTLSSAAGSSRFRMFGYKSTEALISKITSSWHS